MMVFVGEHRRELAHPAQFGCPNGILAVPAARACISWCTKLTPPRGSSLDSVGLVARRSELLPVARGAI